MHKDQDLFAKMHICKKKCEEYKIYRNNNWYTLETEYTPYLPDNAFTLSIIIRDLGICIHVHHSS